ncbi:MAG TPA: Gfo/Idh/MocA family oxidoreductase [Anaerolineales bacterium]|nr:Gfo/Idh/MocA family oxidoreductase [Anaerolineales bacterium]
MNNIRWGLVSTANINRRVIPAIRECQRSELVAVASRDLQQARDYAQKWEIPQAFGSYQAMLDSDQVDAVYVSLPNHLHAEWAIKAMQAGKHVLCEKPFATSLEDVERMIAASQQTGRKLAEAFMYLHHPQMDIVNQWVQSGKLGDIVLVRANFNFQTTNSQDVRLQPELGGGCLWDVGVYPISFAQSVFGGPPDRVFGWQWIGSSSVDEVFTGEMFYPGGGVAQISSSFRCPMYTSAEVIGSEGRLALDRPFVMPDKQPAVRFYRSQEEVEEIPIPKKSLYLGEIEDMVGAILDGSPLRITLDETRNHVKTVLELYQAAKML